MKSRISYYKASGHGFTLIELMVSVAVMALVLVLVSQIIGSVLQTTSVSHQRLDSSQRARAVFESIGRDLSALVSERGMTVFVNQDSSGPASNFKMAFLARGRPPTGVGANSPTTSRFLAVDYYVKDGDLLRSYDSVKWTDYDLLAMATVDRSTNRTATTGTSIIAKGVMRLEAVAVLDNGDILPISETSSASDFEDTSIDGQTVVNFKALRLEPKVGLPRYVRAIIVGVAVIDDRATKMLGADFSTVASKFENPDNDRTPIEKWNDVIKGSALSSYPKPAIDSIFFAQSTFVLK